MKSQEEPGESRSSQAEHNRSQEEPGAARRSHSRSQEEPGGSMKGQEEPGGSMKGERLYSIPRAKKKTQDL